MRTLAFETLKRSSIEIAKEKERLGIRSKSLNRIKIQENPEQYAMLLRTARRRCEKMFRQTGEREYIYIGHGK